MYRMIPVVAVALGLTVSAAAQDSTVKSRTKVSADDAKTITLTGCLAQAGDLFTLRGTSTVGKGDVTTKSKVETDVDNHGKDVKTKSQTEVDHDGKRQAGTPGLTATYELSPQAGVNLAEHVGQRVQLTAVSLDPKKGDKDAKVKVEDNTKVEREHGRDSEVKSTTEATLPRGDHARVMVVAVHPLGETCR